MKPFIPWMGGKSRLADKILPLYPPHRCYVEAFAGAGALLFKKEESKVEVLNDLNGELINLYRVVKHHLVEFLKQFEWALVSRQMFEWEKMAVPDTLTDIQRAARFYYLQRCAFGARPTGQTFGTAPSTPPKFNLRRIEESLSEAKFRLDRVYIENLPWQKVIAKWDRPDTLFYLDPPYWGTQGYGIEFGIKEYEQMAELARTINGKMIISVNAHPKMKRVFRGLRQKTVGINYTVGGNKKGKNKKELIIRSWT